jgi:hypothetical protein
MAARPKVFGVLKTFSKLLIFFYILKKFILTQCGVHANILVIIEKEIVNIPIKTHKII